MSDHPTALTALPALPAADLGGFARVALLGDGHGNAVALRATGYAGAERYVETLETPPTPEEIVADAEAKEFSD